MTALATLDPVLRLMTMGRGHGGGRAPLETDYSIAAGYILALAKGFGLRGRQLDGRRIQHLVLLSERLSDRPGLVWKLGIKGPQSTELLDALDVLRDGRLLFWHEERGFIPTSGLPDIAANVPEPPALADWMFRRAHFLELITSIICISWTHESADDVLALTLRYGQGRWTTSSVRRAVLLARTRGILWRQGTRPI